MKRSSAAKPNLNLNVNLLVCVFQSEQGLPEVPLLVILQCLKVLDMNIAVLFRLLGWVARQLLCQLIEFLQLVEVCFSLLFFLFRQLLDELGIVLFTFCSLVQQRHESFGNISFAH
jgi:hypothetical protein